MPPMPSFLISFTPSTVTRIGRFFAACSASEASILGVISPAGVFASIRQAFISSPIFVPRSNAFFTLGERFPEIITSASFAFARSSAPSVLYLSNSKSASVNWHAISSATSVAFAGFFENLRNAPKGISMRAILFAFAVATTLRRSKMNFRRVISFFFPAPILITFAPEGSRKTSVSFSSESATKAISWSCFAGLEPFFGFISPHTKRALPFAVRDSLDARSGVGVKVSFIGNIVARFSLGRNFHN